MNADDLLKIVSVKGYVDYQMVVFVLDLHDQGEDQLNLLNGYIEKIFLTIDVAQYDRATCILPAIVCFDKKIETIRHFDTVDSEKEYFPKIHIQPNSGGERVELNSAIKYSLSVIEECKTLCKENGVCYYRPHAIVVSDFKHDRFDDLDISVAKDLVDKSWARCRFHLTSINDSMNLERRKSIGNSLMPVVIEIDLLDYLKGDYDLYTIRERCEIENIDCYFIEALNSILDE